ncbi:hypothetical protein AB434_0315 [Heyndrickxia coagulans]|uniref:Uncharacterized protein n=1 Tax=Heyndrickxia coagulans TaxID=1398 RepID=A0AAN0WAT8_HEYCO|nr:hypothetical protein SB48_HM08orf01348 [Heyndrickxia coagulans]AKN52720.1 hypothetical protein AB434_0315 [Heyndrickxia coagulans]
MCAHERKGCHLMRCPAMEAERYDSMFFRFLHYFFTLK